MRYNLSNIGKRTRSSSPEIIYKFIVELERTEKQFRWVVQRFRCKYGKYSTNKCNFIVLSQVNEILTVISFINGKYFH